MKNKLHAFLISMFLMFAAPLTHAAPTTWEYTGRITYSSGTFSAYAVGSPFRIVVSFDSDASLLQTSPGSAGGARYRFSGASLQYALFMEGCSPCAPAVNAANSAILVRDNYSTTVPGDAVDGYTFNLVTPAGATWNLLLRGPVLDIVNGPVLPLVPDPRLPGLPLALLQACDSLLNDCASGELEGQIDPPAYGTGYSFTARDCRVPATDPDAAPADCVNNDRRAQRWSWPPQGAIGGGLGAGSLTQTHSPMSSELDAASPSHAALNLPVVPLGTVSGVIAFGGPVALPVVRGTSLPSDVSRTNANLFAYQRYNYTGPVTLLPLALDLTFTMGDFNVNSPFVSDSIGLRPGGAGIGAVLTIIDGNVSMPMVRDAGVAGFNNLTCGAETELGWQPGSILGVASYDSPEHLVGVQAVLRNVESCRFPGQAVQLAEGQSFIVATSMQLPARGKAPQPPSTSGAGANGFVDAANTLRVTFDPATPPALMQQLAQTIAPACTSCGFAPEVLAVGVNVKPGDSKSCINRQANGVIPVAILGSHDVRVQDIRLDNTLRLGTLQVRMGGKTPLCSVSRVNSDGYDDLVCHFENNSGNWQTGQNSVTLTGVLNNGVPISGSDTICVK